jgi:hypothetical protein
MEEDSHWLTDEEDSEASVTKRLPSKKDRRRKLPVED